MIGQNVDKMKRLLEQSNHGVPEVLFKLYTFVRTISLQLKEDVAEYQTTTLFARTMQFFKKCLVDEPFLLTKLKLSKITQSLGEQNQQQPIRQIGRIREQYFKQGLAVVCQNPIERQVVQQMKTWTWIQGLLKLLEKGDVVVKQLQLKGKKPEIALGEMVIACWYSQYQEQYMVHIDSFITYFQQFAHQHYLLLPNNKYTFEHLRSLCDPEGKHFVTVNNCQDLLFKLRDTQLLNIIDRQIIERDQGQPGQHSIQVTLVCDQVGIKQRLVISGSKVKREEAVTVVKTMPNVMVGSSADCEIVICNKYVSRKQLMIIEHTGKCRRKEQSGQYRYFSLVCLSLSNPTTVKYPKPIKLHMGMMFYAQDIKYEVINLLKESTPNLQDEDERTLTLLPTHNNPNNNNHYKQTATFFILSGQDRNQQIQFNTDQLTQVFPDKHRRALARHLLFKEGLRVKEGTKVLLKSANDILEGRMSRQVAIEEGMEICLQQYRMIFE